LQEVHDDQKLLSLLSDSTEQTIFQEDKFPFWVYLRLAVRQTVDRMYQFGWFQWFVIMLTFIVLCCLHYFYHIAYIRIVIFFGAVYCAMLGLMLFLIHHVNAYVKDFKKADKQDEAGGGHNVHEEYPVDRIFTFFLNYILFMLCYGASRMICQPWMWQLHFWPVLILTGCVVLISVCFMSLIAPRIPTFAACMSIPPYMDIHNVELMKRAMERQAMNMEEAIKVEEGF